MPHESISVEPRVAAATPHSLSALASSSSLRWKAHQQSIAFGIIYLVWGSTYLAIRVGVQSIPPFMLAAVRALASGVVLLVWARLRRAPRATAREWRHASVAGVLMLAGGNGLVSWAGTRVPSSLAACLVALIPSYIVLFEWARPGGARPSRAAALGVCIGMLGMLLLIRPAPGVIGASHWEGVAALALAGMCWALGTLYARYRPMHPDRVASAGHQMIAAGGALCVAAALHGELGAFDASRVTARSLVALVYLTLFGSLLAFSIYNWLIGVTTPARLSTTAYVNPLIALTLGWIILGETLPPVSLAGGLLIISAVVLMTRNSRASAPPTTPALPPSTSDSR